jgi:hypothetical protein
MISIGEELEKNPKYHKYRDKWFSLPMVSEEDYASLHTANLVPLDIVIDCNKFEEEMKSCHSDFTYWGLEYDKSKYPFRYGLGLTDTDMTLPESGYNAITIPLDKWSYEYPDYPLIESDFNIVNDKFKSIQSLKYYMNEFYDHHYRTCILWWNNEQGFSPHRDTSVPAPQIRLWGTNDPENYNFSFWDGKKYMREENVERGRLYLCDTNIKHFANAEGDFVYTFFFALHPNSYDLIKKHLMFDI